MGGDGPPDNEEESGAANSGSPRKVLDIAPTEFGTGVRAALERHGTLDRERAPLRYLFLFALDWDGDSVTALGQPELSQLALAS